MRIYANAKILIRKPLLYPAELRDRVAGAGFLAEARDFCCNFALTSFPNKGGRGSLC
jgi:hypothetical protein